MARKKDAGLAGSGGRSSAAQKVRKKNRQYNDHDRPHIPGLVAKPALPKSKHKTILEWTENRDKKKKLEIEFTTNKNPNANFSFVPVGNPEITSMCKELSREQGALVYIVSTTKEKGTDLSDHVHRIGYHFRTHIVEQANIMLEGAQSHELIDLDIPHNKSGNKPDPIPESQEEINKQADAAIRDLFPRIPNTDREMIVRHAFQKGAVFNGKPVVGLQADLTLSRRVQLAVIAHIRHTHTRYDLLLRETSWENARRTVESLCLDILVKWRGDEETGRDQLDEVLREIVVIDDSDDEVDQDDDESDETSASDDEEVNSSDGIADAVAAANIGITKAALTPPGASFPKPHPAPVLASKNLQNPNQTDPSHQNHGIASRTRSKTKPNHRQRAKKSRRNKRFQAWQDALRRRGERASAPRTPFDQPVRTTVRELDEGSRPVLNRTPVGQSKSEIHTAPHNSDYQTIYAIDSSRGPRRAATYLPSSRRITGPLEYNYNERMLTSLQADEPTTLDYRPSYDEPRRHLSKALPFRTSGSHQSYASSRNGLPSQDMTLPSIERPTDMTNDSPRRANPYAPIRYDQVTYPEVEPEQRYFPAHNDTIYVSSGEDNQAKRRRVVLIDDRAHTPISSRTANSHVRFMPVSGSEQPALIAPSSSRVVEIRDDRVRHDAPIMVDRRNDYPRYLRHVAGNRDQETFSSMKDVREPAGIDRERCIVIEDSPPHARIARRPPGPNLSYFGHSYAPDPQTYESQREADRRYFDTSRPTLSTQDQFYESNRCVGPPQSTQPVMYDRAPPSYQHEVAQGSSASLSAFPYHPHSAEGNSGLVSYPILSRPHHRDDSSLASARDEPILVVARNSHQFPQERHERNGLERLGPQGRQENRRPVGIVEVPRVERRYVPVDPSGIMQQVQPHYVPISPPGIVRRPIRDEPANASGLNKPTYVRKLPHRDEVIVLSP